MWARPVAYLRPNLCACRAHADPCVSPVYPVPPRPQARTLPEMASICLSQHDGGAGRIDVGGSIEGLDYLPHPVIGARTWTLNLTGVAWKYGGPPQPEDEARGENSAHAGMMDSIMSGIEAAFGGADEDGGGVDGKPAAASGGIPPHGQCTAPVLEARGVLRASH